MLPSPLSLSSFYCAFLSLCFVYLPTIFFILSLSPPLTLLSFRLCQCFPSSFLLHCFISTLAFAVSLQNSKPCILCFALLCFAICYLLFHPSRSVQTFLECLPFFSLFISSPLCPFPIPPFVPLLSSLPPVLNYSLVSINGKHPEPNRHQRSCVTSFSSFFRVFCFLQIDVRDEILSRLCVFFHIRVKKPFKKSRRKKKFK